MSDLSLRVLSSSSEHADRSDACAADVAASDAAADPPVPADSLSSRRPQPLSSSPFSASSRAPSVTLRPSHDFNRLLAEAREHHGTVLFADAVALDAVSRCDRSLLNPHCGALANDVLDYHLRPLVRVPHLVVCGVGEDWEEAYALPLSAASPGRVGAIGGQTRPRMLGGRARRRAAADWRPLS